MNSLEINYLINNKKVSIDEIYEQMDKSTDISGNNKYFKLLLNESKELKEFLKTYSIYEIFYHLKHNKHFGYFKCPICGNPLKYDLHNRKYYKTCMSNICINEFGKQRREQTSLERYGVKNAGGTKESLEKIKNTKLKKYGDEKYINSEKIKDVFKQRLKDNPNFWKERNIKSKKEKYKKYGDENYNNIEQIKKTNIEKYGKETIMATKEYKEKLKKENLQKYGVEWAMQRDEIKTKVVETFKRNHNGHGIDFFGYNNNEKLRKIMKSEEYLNKIKITKKKNLFEKLLENEFVQILTPFDIFKEGDKNTIYLWKCKKCGQEFESKINNNWWRQSNFQSRSRCPKCFSKLNGESSGEVELAEYIKNIYHGQIIKGSFKIIGPYQLDLFLPEINIGIEFNGIFYHSIEAEKIFKKHIIYPLEKTNLCEQKNIKLIHIWEDEWIYDNNRIKKELFNQINNIQKNFHGDELCLDRQFNSILTEINGYHIKKIIEPKLISRHLNSCQNFNCYDCGYIIYERENLIKNSK